MGIPGLVACEPAEGGAALPSESVAFVIYCVLACIVPVGKGAAG